MMKNLKVDSDAELAGPNMDASRDRSLSDATSCVSSAGDAAGSIKESDADHEPLAEDGGMPHPAGGYCEYYYPGYACPTGASGAQGCYAGGDGLEVPHPVMLSDNGSFVYFMPGLQPGYTPYSSYVPVTMVGVDGQFAGQQLYPPSSLFHPSMTSHGYFPPALSYGDFVPSPSAWDPSLFGVGSNGNGYTRVENSGSKPLPHVSSYHRDAFAKGYNQRKTGLTYQNKTVDTTANTKGWVGVSKLKARSKANGGSEFGSLNEQKSHSNSKTSFTSVGDTACYDNEVPNISATPIKKDQYNLPDFQTKYDHACFFVIKSYSEDDIHKSIKYNVWSSTPNGNKRLDNAYREAQERTAQKGSKCPVFLYFSVNASGQFCGAAEMIGPVDYNKNMDFWQQDKWTGYFPVKWHIIKDVPNSQLRHIILENNDNKPVTNSRDTQEVKFPQGIEMLNIFKNYKSKTSILDDFEFYESRQKVIQEKKIWQSLPKYNNKAAKIASQPTDMSSTTNIEKPRVEDQLKG